MRITYDIELRESFEGLRYAYFCRLACVGRERHGDVARTGLVVLKFSGKEDVRLGSFCRCRVDGSNPVGKRKREFGVGRDVEQHAAVYSGHVHGLFIYKECRFCSELAHGDCLLQAVERAYCKLCLAGVFFVACFGGNVNLSVGYSGFAPCGGGSCRNGGVCLEGYFLRAAGCAEVHVFVIEFYFKLRLSGLADTCEYDVLCLCRNGNEEHGYEQRADIC